MVIKNWEDLLTQSNSSESKKSSEDSINKSKNHGNRGIEVILNGGKKKQPKPFQIVLEKMVCFFKREVNIYFKFSLGVKKIK